LKSQGLTIFGRLSFDE